MAVELEITDINTIEEAIRPAYVEKDGKFLLDVERYAEIKEQPLRQQYQKILDEKKKLEQTSRTLEEKSKSGLGDVEKQLQERDREIAGLKTQVREHSIWGPVKDMAIKSGVMPDRINAFMTLLRTGERFDMEDGKLIFKDKNGYPTTIKPERAFEVYLREEEAWAFEASKAAGSGAQNGTKSPGTRTYSRESFEALPHDERWKVIREGARIVD
jgi:hypothetical protein